MIADRDVFSERLEHDRRLRRLAISMMPNLLVLTPEDARHAIEKARKLVQMMDGQQGPTKPVSAAAASLYASLPLEDPKDALRTLHLLEASFRWIEEGVIDVQVTKDIARYLGVPIVDSKHLRLVSDPANDAKEVLVSPSVCAMKVVD